MLAIIPARGGSKGLVGKNIKNLEGKPLIAYTIEAALSAKCIDQVIVNTDDEQIAEIAKKFGAEIPFIRNAELAQDNSSAIDVYIDTIERLDLFEKNTTFMVLLPTVPFRTGHHIDDAYRVFCEAKAKTLISVTEAEVPASWYLKVTQDGILRSCEYGTVNGKHLNRQLNPQEYIPNGAIYILEYNLLKNNRTYYCEKTVPYIMNREDSIDIDTLNDFEYAEYMMQKKGRNLV